MNYYESDFTDLVRYNRFIELQKSVMVPFYYLLQVLKGEKTEIYFVDSGTVAT